MNRKQIYAALAIARKKACMDDDTYRLLLAKHGAKENDKGRISAKSMTDDQLSAALGDLNGKPLVPGKWQSDFKKRIIVRTEESTTDKTKVLIAIWTDLFNAGALTECQTFQYAIWKGIDMWVENHFGVSKIDWLTEDQLDKAIHALREWYERIKDKTERRKYRSTR